MMNENRQYTFKNSKALQDFGRMHMILVPVMAEKANILRVPSTKIDSVLGSTLLFPLSALWRAVPCSTDWFFLSLSVLGELSKRFLRIGIPHLAYVLFFLPYDSASRLIERSFRCASTQAPFFFIKACGQILTNPN